jgi:hypothetical protein
MPEETQHGLTISEVQRLVRAIQEYHALTARVDFGRQEFVRFTEPFPNIAITQATSTSGDRMHGVIMAPTNIQGSSVTWAAADGPRPHDPDDILELLVKCIRSYDRLQR